MFDFFFFTPLRVILSWLSLGGRHFKLHCWLLQAAAVVIYCKATHSPAPVARINLLTGCTPESLSAFSSATTHSNHRCAFSLMEATEDKYARGLTEWRPTLDWPWITLPSIFRFLVMILCKIATREMISSHEERTVTHGCVTAACG